MPILDEAAPPALVDLDLCVRIARGTFLSPTFTAFFPLFYLGIAGTYHDRAFHGICLWFLMTFFFEALPFTSHLWRNWSWRSEPRLDWENQIVVVTGAAAGLGRIITETLALRNVSVVALDLNEAEFDYDDVYFYKCDVSDRQQVFKVAAQIKEEVGEPTILVNNAGTVAPGSILECTEAQVRSTFGVNTLAHYWTVQAFLPDMLKAGTGHIMTVSSVLAYLGVANLASYSASKAAALSFHESLQVELAQKRSSIRTTVVCPGFIQTGLFKFLQGQTAVQDFCAPPVSPNDVAKAIIGALDNHQSTQICLPFYTNVTPLLRMCPSWLVDLARRFGTVDDRVPGRPLINAQAPKA